MTDTKKIIVIDDDQELVSFMTMLLQDNGYQTVEANNGEQGLQRTRQEHPDLILLDISMPEKSGVRFYRELCGDDELKDIPVVMVTGVTEDFKRFIHQRKQVPPPAGYLTKPVDQQELLATITKLLT